MPIQHADSENLNQFNDQTSANAKDQSLNRDQKPSLQAKGFNGKPLQPIQSKQGKQPPIQAKGFNGQPLQPIQRKNKAKSNGLPDQLKSNMEQMSGMDLSDVTVQKNSDKPAQLKAEAYAQGSDIHLAPGQEQHLPHEAWHVVQQKQGRVQPTIQANNGAHINDDPALEKEADVMGAKANQGNVSLSAGSPIQAKYSTPTIQAKQDVVQRVAKNSHYGTFTDATYNLINSDTELDMELKFTPNNNADATKVGLTQISKNKIGGKVTAMEPNEATKMTGDGHVIDQHSEYRNPLYATGKAPLKNKDKLEAYKTFPKSWGQHAEKNASTKKWTDAILYDTPSVDSANDSSLEFETAAVALEGNQKGAYYGSVKWGWIKSATGKVSKVTFDIVSKGTPSKNFMKAAKLWNDGKTRGTLKAKADNTSLYDSSIKEIGKLKADDKFKQKDIFETGGVVYVYGKVTTGAQKGKNGRIKFDDLQDTGDGKDTVDLPFFDVQITKENNVPLYQDAGKATKTSDLPQNTRLKVLGNEKGLQKVEIVDGAHTGTVGYLDGSKIEQEK